MSIVLLRPWSCSQYQVGKGRDGNVCRAVTAVINFLVWRLRCFKHASLTQHFQFPAVNPIASRSMKGGQGEKAKGRRGDIVWAWGSDHLCSHFLPLS